jgi:ABC-type transporter Mla MlaB component
MGCLQHLSLSNCRLEDEQCHDIVLSLMDSNKKDRAQEQQPESETKGFALMELNLDGNRCQMLGLKALSAYLPESSLLALDLSNQKISAGSMDLTRLMPGLEQSRLRSLQLSGNVLDNVSIDALTKMLTNNQVLRIVHLAWVPLDERAMLMLANSIRRNVTVSKLVLYGCGIENQGLARFSNRIRQMKGLRQIDMGGVQHFDSVGLHALVSALQRNTEIDHVILPATSNDSIYMEQAHLVGLLCDANRAGRRFLRDQARAPIGLWPLILSQVQRLDLPNLLDGMELPSILPAAPITDEDDEDYDMMSIDDGEDCMDLSQDGGEDNPMTDPGAMRRTSVLYYLLRNGPLLNL